MTIEFRKKFLKELSKLPEPYRSRIERFVFESLPDHDTLGDVGRIERMQGYKNYYKMRFGDYRVGLKDENNTIIIETVKHKREIYKFFP